MAEELSTLPTQPEQERLEVTTGLPTEEELQEMVYGDEDQEGVTPTEKVGLLGRKTTVEALIEETDMSFVAPLHSSNNTYTMPSGDE